MNLASEDDRTQGSRLSSSVVRPADQPQEQSAGHVNADGSSRYARRMTQARWQKLTEWPLAIAAVVFLAAYSYEVIAEPGGSIAEVIIAATWVVFVADYIVNLVLARPRWRWFYTHLLDLAIVVLPLLRPLRLLRLVTLLATLNRTAGAAFRGRVIIYAAGASTLLVYVAGLAVLDAERGGDGSIQTLGQALWWAFVTITTVGYGDYFPVTYTGQLVAVGVMIGGIALIGVVTATLASWIVERVEQREAVSEAITSAHIEALTNEITSLRQLIEGKVGETPPASAKYPGGPPLGGLSLDSRAIRRLGRLIPAPSLTALFIRHI